VGTCAWRTSTQQPAPRTTLGTTSP
jgi:hypothetical protein